MKRLQFSAILIIIATMFACKKQEKSLEHQSNNEITSWLQSEAKKATKFRGDVIKQVENNLEMQKIVKKSKNNITVSVIPIGSGFKNDNNSTKNVINYLVYKKNVKTNKDIGFIYQFHIKNTSVSKGEIAVQIANEIVGNAYKINSQITILTIADYYLFDNYYENNNLVKRRNVRKKNENRNTTEDCTDWYYIEYNYITGEIVSQTFLYTDCTDCLVYRANPESERMADPEDCSYGQGTPGWIMEYSDGLSIFEQETNFIATNQFQDLNFIDENGIKSGWVTWDVSSNLLGTSKIISKEYYKVNIVNYVQDVQEFNHIFSKYDGTNYFTTSTWKENYHSKVINNNNTTDATAKMFIDGDLHSKSKYKVPIPTPPG